MDTETMKSVLSLLVWGALLFLIMRYGCGAHVMGGHGRHGRQGDARDSETRDPVCGISVKPEGSPAAAVHQGKTYYFCSRSCRDQFEANPDRYPAGTSEGFHHA